MLITQSNVLSSFLEERYLSSVDDCRVYYLPLFNLDETVWSPLRVEMFKRLRHANRISSVVKTVFTKDCNPEGDKDAVSFISFDMPNMSSGAL